MKHNLYLAILFLVTGSCCTTAKIKSTFGLSFATTNKDIENILISFEIKSDSTYLSVSSIRTHLNDLNSFFPQIKNDRVKQEIKQYQLSALAILNLKETETTEAIAALGTVLSDYNKSRGKIEKWLKYKEYTADSIPLNGLKKKQK